MPAVTRTELFPRLRALCAEFEAEGGIRCDVALDACHLHFDDHVSDVVFRTVRELLTNVGRHARATQVKVSSMARRDGSIGIAVADDGIGLPAHKRRGNPFAESGGIGLWSIDQRLREFAAVLDVEAAAGCGTCATIILPADLLVAR